MQSFRVLSVVCMGVTGLPRNLSGKESSCSAGDTGSISGSVRSPAPVFLPGKSHGQRSLADDSPWDHKGTGHD